MLFLIAFFGIASASANNCSDLTYKNGYLLSPADHEITGKIYQLGYTDSLFKIVRGETKRTQERVKPIYNQAIYDDMKAMNDGLFSRSLPNLFKKQHGLPLTEKRDPNDFIYNFVHYKLTQSSNGRYQKIEMEQTQTHESRVVDLSRVPTLQNYGPRYQPIILGADSRLNRLVYALYDKVGSTDVRFYALNTRGLQNKMVFQCRDCFYLLRWYGINMSGWLQDKPEFWISSDNSQKMPSHFMRMKFSAEDETLVDPVVTTHSVYRDNQSFSSFGHGMMTEDFQFMTITSTSRNGNFSNIYSAKDGRLIHQGLPTIPNVIGQDFIRYAGDATFLRIKSSGFKDFKLTTLKCTQTACKETYLDSGSRVSFLGETGPLESSYETHVFGSKLVIPLYRNLRPEVVIYDLKTKAVRVALPPIATDVSVGAFDATKNQLVLQGGNAVLENLESVLDLNSGTIVQTTNTSPHQFTAYKMTRTTVVSKDGTRVPVTLLIPSGVTPNVKTPLMVYGYGEYGTPAITYWMNREHFAPLIKRGFVIAYAHVRGGGDLGEQWRQRGTHLLKIKGIEDFEAVLSGLHKSGISNPDRTAIKGFSAGGTMVTSVLARHPELFKIGFDEWGVSDAINFALDQKSFLSGRERMLPLGNPSNPTELRAICERSGLQQTKSIPARNIIWVTASEDDLQVVPWIPAGYFAKVRMLTPNAYWYSMTEGSHLWYPSMDEFWRHLTSQYSVMEKSFGLN